MKSNVLTPASPFKTLALASALTLAGCGGGGGSSSGGSTPTNPGT